MESSRFDGSLTRRGFGRSVALAGAGALGAAALARADDDRQPPPPPRRGRGADDHHGGRHAARGVYFEVHELPFHLQHEFEHAVSCNNVVARAEEVDFGGADSHAILQRPGTFGWGTVTFFLLLDHRLVGQDMTFFSTVGWNGRAEGDVMFSVEINGDIVIDGARTEKNKWVEVERTLPVKAAEMRITLMVDSIGGDNDFSFWWGEPQLTAARGGHPREHQHEHRDGRQGTPFEEDRR